MAISQLNTIFAKHHRIIFGIFSVIIIIAFTDFLTPGTGIVDAFRGTGRGEAAGEIFGKTVSYAELGEQIRTDMLAMQVFMNMQINQSMREQLENNSFYNLANLAAAEQANIAVSDEEVARFLRNFFRDEKGKFNLQTYRNFVENYLRAEGFTEDDLNQAARQYLVLAKFQAAQNASVVVTPDELKQFYNMLNEEYEVLICDIKAADFAKNIKVDAAALESYFAANRSKYVIPAQVQALVVEFPYSKFRSQAIKNVKDQQIKEFYEQNKNLFGTVKDGKFEIPELNKVKDQVRSSAIAAAARELAVNEANKFGTTAYEAVSAVPAEQRLNVFKKQLAAAKLQVQLTGRFAADSTKAGKIAEPELVKELAGVFMDMPISNAVPGEKAVYIGYVTELIPSRPAELKEVKAKVTADYIQQESMKAARTRGEEVAAKLNAMPINTRSAKALADKTNKFKALKKFTLTSGSPELGYNIGIVTNLQPGEVAPVIAQADGVQVLMLAARKAPAEAYKADKNLEAMFRNYKQSMLQMEYNAYLNANCKRYAQPAEAEAVAE